MLKRDKRDPNAWRLGSDGTVYRLGKMRYSNGDLYTGEICQGKRCGSGKMEYKCGDVYTGEFDMDKFHGKGCFVQMPYTKVSFNNIRENPTTKFLIQGERYEGTYCMGQKMGYGVWDSHLGHYEGEFKDNQPSGEGKMVYSNGLRYIGNWWCGKWNAHGEITYPDGTRYTGTIEMGYPHGFGTLVQYKRKKNEMSGEMKDPASMYDDTSKLTVVGSYTGNYHRGLKHGKGSRVFEDQSTFEGCYRYGEMTGEGTITRKDTTIFRGTFLDGKPYESGFFQYGNGDQYEGQLLYGHYYGHGKYTYGIGGFYKGEYLKTKPNLVQPERPFPVPNSKRHGHGVRVWANGNKYEGHWVDDKMQGKGVFTFGNGFEYHGDFDKNQQTGQGVLFYVSTNANQKFEFPSNSGTFHQGRGECRYEGGFYNGEFHGQGVFHYLDGRYYKGSWKNGKRHGQGEQKFLCILDEGNPKRQYIGKGGSMYRIVRYVGNYIHNVRQGNGMVYYANGDTISGHFENGHPHGQCTYTYSKSRIVVTRDYVRGTAINA